jgi:hypothetical protein
VSQSESIANRLLKLVNYLASTTPYQNQGWGRFRDTTSFNGRYGTYDLVWSLVIIGGHSQGSGAALYAGKFYDLLGISMLAGPQDSWDDGGVYVARWITEGGFVTPPAEIFAFGNDKDARTPSSRARRRRGPR